MKLESPHQLQQFNNFLKDNLNQKINTKDRIRLFEKVSKPIFIH